MSFSLGSRRTTQAYGVPNPRYAKGYHRGLDKGADGGEVARWLVSGKVTQITRNSRIGTWVETTNESGVGSAFVGYGHTRAPDGLRVGDTVTAGRDGPIVNGYGDDHGSDWDGPHVHLWTGSRSGDMGVSWGSDADPLPLFGTISAGGGVVIIPPAPNQRKRKMSYSIAKQVGGSIWYVNLVSGKRAQITDPSHIAVLKRLAVAMDDDTFYDVELDIQRGYATLTMPDGGVNLAPVMAELRKVMTAIGAIEYDPTTGEPGFDSKPILDAIAKVQVDVAKIPTGFTLTPIK